MATTPCGPVAAPMCSSPSEWCCSQCAGKTRRQSCDSCHPMLATLAAAFSQPTACLPCLTALPCPALACSFWLEGGWIHDLSLDGFAGLTVFANGGGTDMNFDCHRAGTHSNLFSNIDVGLGTRTFASGGAKHRGAHSGEAPHQPAS